MKIDINCDMGESFGAYTMGSDLEMMSFITSANIACGYHGGDPTVMDRTVKMAVEHGVQVGCHPGFPDLMGFGRRVIAASSEEVESYVLYQLGALWGFAGANRAEVRHVKAHGALGNMAFADLEVARAIVKGVARFSKELIMVCLSGTPLVTAARKYGLPVIEEGYPERGYNADGTLQSRKMAGAVIHDPDVVVERAVRMIRDGIVVAHTGESVKVSFQSLCIHGDNPAAPKIAASLIQSLTAAGIEVRPMAELL